LSVTSKEKRIILYVLYCAILVVVIVGIVLAFRPTHTNPSVATHGTTKSHSPAGSTTGKGGNTGIATNKSSSSASSSSASSSATNPALNNTGPGNVIGVFVGASILGAWFWRRKLMRSVIR
jgi:hypothetical protein